MKTADMIALVADDGTVFVKASDMAKILEREQNCPHHIKAVSEILKNLVSEAKKAAVNQAMVQKKVVHEQNQKPLH